MAKGGTLQLSFQDFTDPTTGTRVTRLTPPDVISHRNYFYQKCFSKDGSQLMFGSEFDGAMNHWLVDLGTGLARQLTEGVGCNTHGAFLSPDDRYLYYVRNSDELRRVDLQTLEEEVVYAVPELWKGAGTWVPNTACTRFAAMEIWDADRVTDCTGWEWFTKQYYQTPRSRLISIDGTTGTAKTVLEQKVYMGHPMYRPFHDETMGFCHEGPHDLVDARMWLIDENGEHLRKVKAHAPGESCMHEFWVPDGSRMIYVSYTKGEQSRYVWAADPVTLKNEMLMPMPPCSHIMSNYDGSLLVGDGAGQLHDVSDQEGHAFEADPYLHVFDLKRRTTQRICAHNSSWREYKGNHQTSHPHPSFVPGDKRVLFTSDFEGLPAVYLADVPAL
ncbi:MAG: oligogalacturonate lyase [Rhodocyclales bacterium]|nr:oligogalacturonate lyase [Rhodocyclales bacterium]